MGTSKQKKKTNGEPDTRLIGYARVSTPEQSVQMQVDALLQAGVQPQNIHTEQVSGVSKERPAFDEVLTDGRPGDILVVWKLDRIARSIIDLLEKLKRLELRGLEFRSLTEQIDTSTPSGRFLMHVIGAFAQLERDLISERTAEGVRRAQARGIKFGAVPKLKDADVPKAIKMMREKGQSQRDVAEHFSVSPQTIYRRCKEYEETMAAKEKKGRKSARRPKK